MDVLYEDLEDLEDEFEDVEVQLLRESDAMTRPLYARREKMVAKIPNFWPLVFEQAPPEIDECIQPTDAALLLALKSLSVERFELPEGDPRSVIIRFEFNDNEYFENKVLEKKFWWRCAKDGWSGLVSEPVNIAWKSADKDLTAGLLGLACKVWEEDKAGKADDKNTEAKKKLRALIDKTGMHGNSVFAWFGFRGRDISPEEHLEACRVEEERRKAIKEGKEPPVDETQENDDDDDYELEIFHEAEDLAAAIAEDLWPGAIKYFIQGQELDAMSDVEFESGSDADDDDMDDDDEKLPVRNKML